MHVWSSFRFVRRSGGKIVRRCDRCREPLWQHLVVMMMMMMMMIVMVMMVMIMMTTILIDYHDNAIPI